MREATLSGPEKRRFRRVAMVAKIEAEAGGTPYLAEGCNISVGGLLIRSTKTLEENQTLRLKFTLPGVDREIRVTASVRHVSPGAFMGVSFEDLSQEDLAAIERFVNEVP